LRLRIKPASSPSGEPYLPDVRWSASHDGPHSGCGKIRVSVEPLEQMVAARPSWWFSGLSVLGRMLAAGEALRPEDDRYLRCVGPSVYDEPDVNDALWRFHRSTPDLIFRAWLAHSSGSGRERPLAARGLEGAPRRLGGRHCENPLRPPQHWRQPGYGSGSVE
jgi:hypothetical protein